MRFSSCDPARILIRLIYEAWPQFKDIGVKYEIKLFFLQITRLDTTPLIEQTLKLLV